MNQSKTTEEGTNGKHAAANGEEVPVEAIKEEQDEAEADEKKSKSPSEEDVEEEETPPPLLPEKMRTDLMKRIEMARQNYLQSEIVVLRKAIKDETDTMRAEIRALEAGMAHLKLELVTMRVIAEFLEAKLHRALHPATTPPPAST